MSKYFNIQDLVSPEEILDTPPTKKPRAPEIYSIANHLISTRKRLDVAEQAITESTGNTLAQPNALSKLNSVTTSSENQDEYLLSAPAHTELLDGQWFFVRWHADNVGAATIKIDGITDPIIILFNDVGLSGGELAAGETNLIIYHAGATPYFELKKKRKSKNYHYEPISSNIITSVGSQITLDSFSYVRVFSNSKVAIKCFANSLLEVRKNSGGVNNINDLKGEGRIFIDDGVQSIDISRNLIDTTLSSQQSGDNVKNISQGSCLIVDDTSNSSVSYEIKMIFDYAKKNSENMTVGCNFESLSGGYIEIIEIEN